MSKVKIQGNSSGSGVLTIEAPNTNDDSTITLPDGDVTLGVGIDDNATSTAITINSDESVDFANDIDVTGSVTADGLTVQSNNNLDIHDADNHVSGRLRNVSGSNNALTIEADPNNSASDSFISLKIDTSEKMRIDSSGNVGIGVTPESWNANYSALQIGSVGSLYGYTAVADGAEVVLGCNEYSSKYITADQASQYNQYDGKHFFKVAPSGSADAAISWTDAMKIDNNGSAYFGTTSTPNSSNEGFAVENRGWDLVTMACNSSNSNHTAISLCRGGGGGRGVMFYKDSTNVGNIYINSSSTSFNTSSDYRLKEDVKPMSASIDRLKELKPVNFAWKVDGSRVDGFLAHEAQEVVPEAITGIKDGMQTEEYEVEPAIEATYDEEGNELTPAVEAVMGEREVEDYQGIDQSKLVPLLTSALQEAVAKIEELTTRIEILEAN